MILEITLSDFYLVKKVKSIFDMSKDRMCHSTPKQKYLFVFIILFLTTKMYSIEIISFYHGVNDSSIDITMEHVKT